LYYILKNTEASEERKDRFAKALVLLKPAASTDYCSNYLLHGIVGARNKISGLSKLPQFHFILLLKKTCAFLPGKLSLHVTHPPPGSPGPQTTCELPVRSNSTTSTVKTRLTLTLLGNGTAHLKNHLQWLFGSHYK
jgi:hypothetical protein